MTIVAIATYPGRSALGTVRISGPETLKLLNQLLRPRKKPFEFEKNPRVITLCDLVDVANNHIDEAMAVFYAAPASYTGEDSAEITLHGNPLILRETVQALCQAGARPAEPGEFTSRAFRNGRMDLTKAESVVRLIEARSEYELGAARKLMGGELSTTMSKFRSAVIGLKAETEAEVDFSTEDLTFESLDKRKGRVRTMITEIDSILARARATGRIREGISVALVGAPNAGKSSLLNRIVGYDRAIVTEIPGTTRDTLSEELQIGGIPVRFVDTAGIRSTDDPVEREGVRRSIREMEASTIVLHIVDGSRPAYDLEADVTRPNVIHILNKVDQRHAEARSQADWIEISCRTGQGLAELNQAVRDMVLQEPESRDPILLEDRHRFHFERIKGALEKILELWERRAPDEIVAVELDEILEHTGRMTGKISTEEVLGRIFSTFCVGK